MNYTLLASNLLAQYSKWQRLGDGLHRSRGRVDVSDMLPYFIGVAVIGVGVAVGVAIAKYNDFSQSCDDPNKLFRELCHAHGLDRSNQRLLRQLALMSGLAQPAEVFLTPSAFDANYLPMELQEEEYRIEELRELLF